MKTNCKRGHELAGDNIRLHGGTYSCRTCERAIAKNHVEQTRTRVQQWRDKNRERFNANARRWKKENRKSCNLATQKWAKNNLEKMQTIKRTHYQKYKASYLEYSKKRRGVAFGLSPEKLKDLTEKQDNKCAICKRTPNESKQKELHVDHCHISKKFRGLLCGSCNRALGLFQDDIERMKSAISYLENFNRRYI